MWARAHLHVKFWGGVYPMVTGVHESQSESRLNDYMNLSYVRYAMESTNRWWIVSLDIHDLGSPYMGELVASHAIISEAMGRHPWETEREMLLFVYGDNINEYWYFQEGNTLFRKAYDSDVEDFKEVDPQ